MEKPYNIELIEQYLNNELKGAALTAFEQELASDEELAQAVADHQDLILGVEVAGERQFHQTLQSVEEELDAKGFFLMMTDVDDYLDKKADATTTQKIESRLLEDSDFASSLTAHNDARQSIELLGELQLRNTIRNIEAELEEEGFFTQKTETKVIERPIRAIGNRVAIRRMLAVAASVAVLVLAYFFIFQPDNSPQGLYSSYYEPYKDNLSQELELRLSETGFGSTDDMRVQLNLLLTGIGEYKAENFAAAAEKLATYRSKANPTDDLTRQASLYEAISRLELKQSQDAITLLTPLAQNDEFAQQADAQWYLALAHLQADEAAAAQSMLQQLKNSEVYGTAATELLEKLTK